MRKTPLRRISKKRQKDLAEYNKLKKAFLEANPYCQVCEAEGWSKRRSEDVHHKAGRSGSNYLDTDTWMAVCRKSHDLIHFGGAIKLNSTDNNYQKCKDAGIDYYGPKWSRFLGYLI
jgi:hypothetical protein